METRLEIERLSKDELAYELAVLGVTTVTTVDDMRATLRRMRRLAKHESFVRPAHPYTVAEDIAALTQLSTEIKSLLDLFAGSRTSSEFKKIKAKLAHATGRVGCIVATTADERQQVSRILVEISEFSSTLRSKAKQFSRSSTPNVSTATVLGVESDPPSSSDSDDSGAAGGASGRVGVAVPLREGHTKPIPVMRWGVKYTGDNSVLSLNAFIERVEELMTARGVSRDQVFAQALDLFSGRASIWFRANRRQISSWDELVVALREEFQAPDYDEQLFDEIRKRTQGPHESIGMYVSTMTSLFSRLALHIPESNRIKIMLRNLAPFYQSQLGLAEVKSVEELLSIGRKLEWRKACADRYVPPPRRQQSMEPDLAYMSSSSSVASVETPSRPTMKCWNCDSEGHLAVRCPAPLRRHCYRCGRRDVTVRNCPKCSLNANRAR